MGIVLFGSTVILKGDCNTDDLEIATDLDNFEAILNQTYAKGENLLTKNLEENYHKLELAIKKIKVDGCTALGPGLLSALGLAGQVKTFFPRNKLILLGTTRLKNYSLYRWSC